MLNPAALYIPVSNHGGPITGPIGLVVHVQEGKGSLGGYFNNPASGVSSHFWISYGGALQQYVDTSLRAWAQAAGNAAYLSVETEGFATEALTSAQLATLGDLWAWVRSSYPTIPDRLVDHGAAGLTTHAFYPSGLPDPAWGGHPCPGGVRSGQLPAIIGQAPQPQPPEVPSVGVYLYAPTTANDPTFVSVDGVVTKVVDVAVVAKYSADHVGGCVTLPADHSMCVGLGAKAAAP